MNTMQDKITSEVQGRVEAYDAEFVVREQYANTGDWYVMRGLTTLFRISYEFNQTYALFKIWPAPLTVDRTLGDDTTFDPWTKRNGMVYYHDGPELAAFLNLIGALIKTGKVAK